MAGQKFLNEIAAEIESRGGEQWFFGEVADGKKLGEIAASLQCSRPLLYQWLDLEPDRDRRGTLKKAREAAADSIVDDLDRELEIAAPVTSAQAQTLAIKTRFRQWLASKYGRASYGDDVAPQVVLNMGQLHAAALRARAVGYRADPAALPAAPIVDAEVVEADRGS